jgi:hypothetical protein
MNTIDYVAWWGAIIATGVLIWDIIKWKKSGPKIIISVSANMQITSDPDNKLWVTIRAKNIGDRGTTITNLAGSYYKNIFYKLFNKAERQFVIPNAGITHPIPHVLDPGTIWDGVIEQDAKLQAMAKEGYLDCELYYSQSVKPIRERITIK